jgi:hypothetical protein
LLESVGFLLRPATEPFPRGNGNEGFPLFSRDPFGFACCAFRLLWEGEAASANTGHDESIPFDITVW